MNQLSTESIEDEAQHSTIQQIFGQIDRFCLENNAITLCKSSPNKKYRLQVSSICSENVDLFLETAFSPRLFKVWIKLDLTNLWKRIMKYGLFQLKCMAEKLNKTKKQWYAFSCSNVEKCFSVKIIHPILQSIDFKCVLSEILSLLKVEVLHSILEQKNEKIQSQFLRKSFAWIQTKRTTRIKSTKKANGEGIEDVKNWACLSNCKSELTAKLKIKFQKHNKIMRVIEFIKPLIYEKMLLEEECRSKIQKLSARYFIKDDDSLNKKVNQLLGKKLEEMIRNQGRDGIKINKEFSMRESILIKKSITNNEKDECFENEKKVLLFLRELKCPSINNYFVFEEVNSLLIKQIYSDYHENSLRQNFSPKRSLKIIQTLMEGIVFLQNCNIGHRDLKPANIVVSKDSTSKMIDFGSSCSFKFNKAMMSDGKHSRLYTSIYYNLHYSSLPPELQEVFTRHEYEINQFFDIHAVGKIMKDLLSNEVREEMGHFFADNLEKLIAQCVQINPEDRPTALDVYAIFCKLIQPFFKK